MNRFIKIFGLVLIGHIRFQMVNDTVVFLIQFEDAIDPICPNHAATIGIGAASLSGRIMGECV